MKTVFNLLLLFGVGSLFAGTAPIKLGDETDYVATAVADLGTPYASNLTSSTGSYGNKGVRVLYGYFMRKIEPGTWSTVPSPLELKLKQALNVDLWSSTLTTASPTEGSYPIHFFTTGERKGETLELFVTMFPAENGVIRIAYEQRRSFSESSPPKGG